jgi:histidyl-tRNA synthetase
MNLRAVKGMNDFLPSDSRQARRVEEAFRRTMERAGFGEVRTPLVEPTALFVRTIGEGTDVVDKEMYSFTRHDEGLTLRPEGTAGAARAYLEHKVHASETVTKWFYAGAMFRAERPQRGRYRQFHQVGGEIYGDPGPACDAELIALIVEFLADLGIRDAVVHVNSLGGPEARARYRQVLVDYLTPHAEKLSADSQRRLATNPLRILDSKAKEDQEWIASAPRISDVLEGDDLAHFEGLKKHLGALGVEFIHDTQLVRGLDYYGRTLFEVKAAKEILGAGSTVVGGGRYDTMVEDLGGPKTPAIGFAAGLERLVLALGDAKAEDASLPVYVCALGDAAISPALVIGRDLRRAGVACEVDGRGQSLKSQLRRANSRGARLALVVGEGELARGVVQLKDLAAHEQLDVATDTIVGAVRERLEKVVAP